MAQPLSLTTAVVLAGGLGSRLRPVVDDRPKVLAPIAGRRFLAYLLHQLADAGFEDVVLCTGYTGDQVRDAFGSRFRKLSCNIPGRTSLWEPLARCDLRYP